MDISKYNKPIHYVCPKCGFDMTFKGYNIVKNRNDLREEVGILKAKMHTHALEYGKSDPYYQKLVKQHKDKTNQLIKANAEVALASDVANREVFEVFKNLVRAEVGLERFKELIQEAENTVAYDAKDLPKQKYTNYQEIG